MHFKNSDRFERSVFGRCSGGQYERYRTFSRDMLDLIQHDIGPDYPDTRSGRLLFWGVYEELKRSGVDPSGLKFKSALGSRADIHHFTDGYFYLPSLPEELVTLDLFNLDSEIVAILKDRWEECCTESQFQTRLFQYKAGMADFWDKGGIMVDNWDHIFSPVDFKSSKKRPENHLVLTPSYTENRQNRKMFVKLVAGYFAKVAKVPDHENTAPLSH